MGIGADGKLEPIRSVRDVRATTILFVGRLRLDAAFLEVDHAHDHGTARIEG